MTLYYTSVIVFQFQIKSFPTIQQFTLYRESQEERASLREGVPYVKVYRYNPKHLCPKLNGYGDNDKIKVWSSGRSTHCTCQLTTLSMSALSVVSYYGNSAHAVSKLFMYFLLGDKTVHVSAWHSCHV